MKKAFLAVGVFAVALLIVVGCTNSKLSEEEYAKKAMDSYRSGRYEDAYSYYQLLLKFYPDSQKASEYKKMLAETIYKLIETSKPDLREGYIKQLQSLGGVADTILAWIKYQDAVKDDQMEERTRKLKQLGLRGIMLAAQYAIDRMKYEDAARAYETALEVFPDDTAAYKVAFLAGYIYSEHLKDYDKAKKYYQMVVEKFPDCELADDAKFMLENMGKPFVAPDTSAAKQQAKK